MNMIYQEFMITSFSVVKNYKDAVHCRDITSLAWTSSSKVMINLDVDDCKCPEVLHSVYPQLVRHWKAIQDIDRTLHYLLEAGAAALSTGNVLQVCRFTLLPVLFF